MLGEAAAERARLGWTVMVRAVALTLTALASVTESVAV